ncbi:hypothetical protein HYC85_010055 [Camellia sinensis]|uniref:Uncharacterized protein n=1 Tax=Camellia sinensis TaxID=4442 RepID=A0A7J7HIQ5_CAMSI|nr:hypothetical protein HYC85_010055 [Camellia sinensis]
MSGGLDFPEFVSVGTISVGTTVSYHLFRRWRWLLRAANVGSPPVSSPPPPLPPQAAVEAEHDKDDEEEVVEKSDLMISQAISPDTIHSL